MTALILVVDDLEPNVRLLEAKLAAEYYDVIVAHDGFGAVAKAKEHKPDIILLDVMMPNMDGFEACRRIKADPETAHIPIVMVTALSEPSDRVQGLQAGADDFLTKPINDVQLLARVKSLVRMKQLIDELRLRGQTSEAIGEVSGASLQELSNIAGANVLVVDDDVVQSRNISDRLGRNSMNTMTVYSPDAAMEAAQQYDFDLIIVSTLLTDADGLRLCSHFRSSENMRHVSLIVLLEENDQRTLVKALEIGVNDYLISPLDLSEMECRVRTNIRRKKYQDVLKSTYKKTVNMAIKDGLTGLYNRHYLNAHLQNLAASSLDRAKPLACFMMDMDHFKQVNDTYGHDVGDEVLIELSERIISQLRGSDLVARYGGEEFVVLLPGCPLEVAMEVAERIRASVQDVPFKISHEVGHISKTVSIGLSMLFQAPGVPATEAVDKMLKNADEALYAAKHGGRNQVIVHNQGQPPADAPSPQFVAPAQHEIAAQPEYQPPPMVEASVPHEYYAPEEMPVTQEQYQVPAFETPVQSEYQPPVEAAMLHEQYQPPPQFVGQSQIHEVEPTPTPEPTPEPTVAPVQPHPLPHPAEDVVQSAAPTIVRPRGAFGKKPSNQS